MRTLIRALVLVAPLAVVGCKKKGQEVEAPVAQPAPPPPPAAVTPDLVWNWGPVTHAGATGVGKLNVPVRIQNNTDRALIVESWDLGVNTPGGRVCIVRGEQVHKAPGRQALSFTASGDCDRQKLPGGGELELIGSVRYTFGGEQQKLNVRQDVTFER